MGDMEPVAYYNENDPEMAGWLRELIDREVIAFGVVDERSIEDVLPEELTGYTQHHFFAGVGVWSYSLRCAGWPDDRPVWTGSCPCQPFSAAGKRGGFDDERHLWPAFFHLISQCRPVAVFGEQVASKDGLAWLEIVQTDLEGAGYTVGAADMCAAGFGAPHIRQRLWFVAESARFGRRGRGDGNQIGSGREVQVEGRGTSGNLADANKAERECSTGRRSYTGADGGRYVGGSGNAGPLSLPDGEQGHAQAAGRLHAESGECGYVGDARRLADSQCKRSQGGLSGRENTGWSDINGYTGCCGPACELADTNGVGSLDGQYPTNRWGAGAVDQCGPVNGFWRDAIWLPCTDGKERPVKPGAFPLVDGVAKGVVRGGDCGEAEDADNTAEARVMRIRGYGNALVAPVAMEWVRAFMEVKKEGYGHVEV